MIRICLRKKLNLFKKKRFVCQKTGFWKNLFWAVQICPDFAGQIGQQHFFIICLAGETANQLFLTNNYPNGPSGNRSILGSQIEEKSLSVPGQNGKICVNKFLHHLASCSNAQSIVFHQRLPKLQICTMIS